MRNRRAVQAGLYVVLLAIFLPVLLLLIGIGVDLSLASVSQQQNRGYTRLLSLAAVETYFDQGGQTLTQSERLDRVLTRVNELGGNYSVAGNPNDQPKPLGYRRTGQPLAPGGNIVPGRYYFSNVDRDYCPDLECQNSCDNSNKNCNPCGGQGASAAHAPCFYELSYDDITNPVDPKPVSAFRIETRMFDDLLSRFASAVLGETRTPVNGTSTATAIPRRVMFVVDTTGSTSRETYKIRTVSDQEQTPQQGRGSKYAFFLSRDNWSFSGPSNTSCSQSTAPYSDDIQWRFLEDFDPVTSSYSLPITFEGCPAPVPGAEQGMQRAGSDPAAVHYYDDYSVVEPLHFPDQVAINGIPPTGISPETLEIIRNGVHNHVIPQICNGGHLDRYCAEREIYRVDTCCERSDCGLGQPWCQGPQPFGAILSGLRDAVGSFRERMVSGDKMGLIFFDSDTTWPRTILPTNEFSYLEAVISNPEVRRALKIFPGKEAFTDLRAGLSEAINQLALERQRSGGIPTQDMIVLISDGMSNCAGCGNLSRMQAVLYDLNNDGLIGLDDYFRGIQCLDQGVGCACDRCLTIPELMTIAQNLMCYFGCSNDYNTYRNSMNQVSSMVSGLTAADSKIPIHVIAVGRDVAPHTIDIQDPSTTQLRCLSDSEARALNIPIVRGGFLSPTGGQLQCIPEYCDEAFRAASAEYPFYESVANLYYIARASGGNFMPLYMDQAPGCATGMMHCDTNPNSSDCCRPGHIWFNDKFCRSPEAQMHDYVERTISGHSPYVIVDSD